MCVIFSVFLRPKSPVHYGSFDIAVNIIPQSIYSFYIQYKIFLICLTLVHENVM